MVSKVLSAVLVVTSVTTVIGRSVLLDRLLMITCLAPALDNRPSIALYAFRSTLSLAGTKTPPALAWYVVGMPAR